MVLAIFSGKSTAVHSILNIGWWAEIYDDETPTFSNSCLSTLLDEFQLVAAVYVWNFNRSNILWRKFFSQCKLELVYIFLSCIWFFIKSETETTYFCWLASRKKRKENYDDGKTYLIKVKKNHRETYSYSIIEVYSIRPTTKEIGSWFELRSKNSESKILEQKMGRRTINRICEIKYPSRVEGWLDVCGKFMFTSLNNDIIFKAQRKIAWLCIRILIEMSAVQFYLLHLITSECSKITTLITSLK